MNRRTGPQSDDMGETHAGAFDLPRPGVAAQMQAQLIEIGDTRGTDRMPLRQETSRDVDRYTPAERSSPAVDHVIGLAGAATLPILIMQPFGCGEAVGELPRVQALDVHPAPPINPR